MSIRRRRSCASPDGARTWQRFAGAIGRYPALAVDSDAVFSTLGDCVSSSHGPRCTRRLAHAALGSTHWTSVPIPGTAGGPEGFLGVTAVGDRALISYQQVTADGQPELLTSGPDGAGPFTDRAERALATVNGCGLQAPSAQVVVATCPGGMTVAYLSSDDGGRKFTRFWDRGITAGGVLDVVDDNLLYRYTGYVVTNLSLQRSTDGGRIFVTIRRVKPPAAVSALTFVSRDVGYELDDGLLSTDDGGRTWTPVTLPG